MWNLSSWNTKVFLILGKDVEKHKKVNKYWIKKFEAKKKRFTIGTKLLN